MTTIDSEFKPGTSGDYAAPCFDESIGNWQDYFTEMIQVSKGRYLMLNIPRLGIIPGRVDVPKSGEGEFIFQTGERIFYSIGYDEITEIFVRK